MDEEFYFPENVRTSYRLWLLGPHHLKRLTLAPVPALLAGWLLHEVSLVGAVALAVAVASAYAGICCVPLSTDDQTLWDVGRELLRHRRSQTRFPYRKEA